MAHTREMFGSTALRPVVAGVLGLTLACGMLPLGPFQAGAAQAQSALVTGDLAKQNAGGSGNGGNNGNGDATREGSGQQGAGSGSGGGQPVWAQEGIPEIELGRLNVARSPDRVLTQALNEALANLTPETIAFLNLSLDDMIDQLSLHWDEISIIDSPLENLALLRDLLDGTSVLSDQGVTTSVDTLAALFIGVASDKTMEITTDTVVALTAILGYPVTGDDAAALADAAESIRIAVLAGHDG